MAKTTNQLVKEIAAVIETPAIVREGSFFRAVAPGFRSYIVTSAAGAGKIILKRYGKDAERVAFENYCKLV